MPAPSRILFFMLLLQKDGTGDYTTVQSAIDAVPREFEKSLADIC